jgi:hypothetical protein
MLAPDPKNQLFVRGNKLRKSINLFVNKRINDSVVKNRIAPKMLSDDSPIDEIHEREVEPNLV